MLCVYFAKNDLINRLVNLINNASMIGLRIRVSRCVGWLLLKESPTVIENNRGLFL